jgi:hypothetical protein
MSLLAHAVRPTMIEPIAIGIVVITPETRP